MTMEIGPCDVCGEPAHGPLCERCKTAKIGAEGALKVLAGLDIPEPTEWEVRRLARLSSLGRFMVGVAIESCKRSGAPITLSEAIGHVEAGERRERQS